MRFKGLDLNLLVTLDALMRLRSVSRAAEKLNLSQPAVSGALGRLRAYFNDDLFVAHGKGMLPTTFAESLMPHVNACLGIADTLVSTTSSFEPASSHRVFRLVASDYAAAAVLSRVVVKLATVAPNVRLEITLPSDRVWHDLEEGRVDLFFTPDEYADKQHPLELMFEENHVVAGCETNPLLSAPLSESAFFDAAHVAVSFGRDQPAFADRYLAATGRQRRVEIVVPGFTMVPWLLEGTPRLALMHERLAYAMAGRFSLAFQPVPFALPVMREVAQFHSARIADEALRWLRELVRDVAADASVRKPDAL